MWKPVFTRVRSSLCGWPHPQVDVGGAVPQACRHADGSASRGLRVPPSRLYRAGVLDETLLRTMMTNVRVPEQNWGDLKRSSRR